MYYGTKIDWSFPNTVNVQKVTSDTRVGPMREAKSVTKSQASRLGRVSRGTEGQHIHDQAKVQ